MRHRTEKNYVVAGQGADDRRRSRIFFSSESRNRERAGRRNGRNGLSFFWRGLLSSNLCLSRQAEIQISIVGKHTYSYPQPGASHE